MLSPCVTCVRSCDVWKSHKEHWQEELPKIWTYPIQFLFIFQPPTCLMSLFSHLLSGFSAPFLGLLQILAFFPTSLLPICSLLHACPTYRSTVTPLQNLPLPNEGFVFKQPYSRERKKEEALRRMRQLSPCILCWVRPWPLNTMSWQPNCKGMITFISQDNMMHRGNKCDLGAFYLS